MNNSSNPSPAFEYTLIWQNAAASPQNWQDTMDKITETVSLDVSGTRYMVLSLASDESILFSVQAGTQTVTSTLNFAIGDKKNPPQWTLKPDSAANWNLSVVGKMIVLACFADGTEPTAQGSPATGSGTQQSDPHEQGARQVLSSPEYDPCKPDPDSEIVRRYPAYQLYEDSTETIYCSHNRVNGHDEGADWIRECMAAHPGTRCKGKPWLSQEQREVIWP